MIASALALPPPLSSPLAQPSAHAIMRLSDILRSKA